MRLPLPGPRDLRAVLEKGADQVEALLGAVPRVLALLDQAEVVVLRASAEVDRVHAVVRDAEGVVRRARGAVADAETQVARVVPLLDAVEAQVARVGPVLDSAEAEVARVGPVLDAAGAEVARVAPVLDSAEAEVARVGSLLDATSALLARVVPLVDGFEPPLTRLRPTVEALADTTRPDEVAALVRLVDHLPELSDRVERDVLPVMTTLGTVSPDLHDLLDASRELNEMLGKLPGLGRIKRRVEEEQAAQDGSPDGAPKR
jgi:ABC-type transporter Mla subunit MlaD